MYNKHTELKTMYQAIIENKVCIEFNTKKKRDAFLRRLNGTRKITCLTNVSYPWSIEDGTQNKIYI